MLAWKVKHSIDKALTKEDPTLTKDNVLILFQSTDIIRHRKNYTKIQISKKANNRGAAGV